MFNKRSVLSPKNSMQRRPLFVDDTEEEAVETGCGPTCSDSVHHPHQSTYSNVLCSVFTMDTNSNDEVSERDLQKSTTTSSLRVDHLRDSLGEFGLALFAPLMDLNEESPASEQPGAPPIELEHKPNSVLTLRTESESETDDDIDMQLLQPIHMLRESKASLEHCPRILSLDQMQSLQEHLPVALRDNVWERVFAIGLDGDSFCSLLRKCAGFKYTVVVIRSVQGEILGGFASEEWKVRDKTGQDKRAYYGSGQSFVFASQPDVVDESTNPADNSDESSGGNDGGLHVYRWTGDNDYCQICDSERRVLCMGGVGDFGLIVSDDFATGQTGSCATFGNPPLAHSRTFEVADFEIYSLSGAIFGFSDSL